MTTTTNTRKVGDKVGIDDPKFPGTWTIKGLGPKNATLTPDHGGRGLRAPYYLLTDPADAGATVTAVPLPTYFAEGEIVRITEGRFAGLYVVIKDNGADKVNVAKLGGNGGRYVRIGKRAVTKVDPADILK